MMAVRTDCSASSGRTMHSGRRAPADALQRGQHLGDGGAAAFERPAQRALAVVERLEPRLGLGDPVFRLAQARGGVDQRLVELAAVLADARRFPS